MPLQAAQAAFLREYKLVVVGGGGELVYAYSFEALIIYIYSYQALESLH